MTLASLSLLASSSAQADPRKQRDDVRAVAPALEKYEQDTLFGDLWKRPSLNLRDRSIVTLAALITRNQTAEMPHYLNLALDNGVKPSEISEIITHLAFYAGWGNAMAATTLAKAAFAARNITADQLPLASPNLLALNEAAEADRSKRVGDLFGAAFPVWCNTPPTFSSVIFGCGPALRHVTGASSQSARWWHPGRSLN
jgi:4-carboxymuconolactone decarboxylase